MSTDIGDNILAGLYAVFLRNIIIGSNSVTGAGAVVTKNVPPRIVVVGNPARMIKELPKPYPCLTSKKY